MLTLHYAPHTCSLASHIALIDAGAEYQTARLDVLTETPAMLAFIAQIAAMQRKVPAAVGECFELIEREMLRGPWVMGEAYTICDPYLFTLAQWLEVDGVDPARIPRVVEHRRRMAERPAVRTAIAEELG